MHCGGSASQERSPTARGTATATANLPPPAVTAETSAGDIAQPAVVDPLDATTVPAPAPEPSVYSVGQTTWIRSKPEIKEGPYLGYIRTGYPVPLRSEDLVQGEGCPRGYYQVAPRGYVCSDRTVTESPRATFLAAALATRPSDATLPYGYGLSNGSPMYNRIPTEAEQERYERWLGERGTFKSLPKTLRSHEEMAEARSIEKTHPVPEFLMDGGSPKRAPYDLVEQTIPLGAMLSYSRVFESGGRTFLLSTDHTIVPADRVRPFKMSTFRGTALGKDAAQLPLAWMRSTAKPKHVRTAEAFEATGDTWAVRTFVGLTGKSVSLGKKTFLETHEMKDGANLFIDAADATVAEAETKLASGVEEGQKWFMIRLSKGTLVAYEGMTPTYATLISPGKGGIPTKGNDPVEHSTTPLGSYSITFKDRYATMSPETGKNRSFWIQDVPHTMYFDAPFAMHAAFWHERFGEYVSAGCVNLSPLDAERLFEWTDPPLPKDWQGVTGPGASDNGPTTIVVIRR